MTAPPGVLRHLQLNLKILDSGGVQVSSPQARQFALAARGPDQLWRAVALAFAEARQSGHAAWCGQPSDPADAPPVAAAPVAREGVSWSKNAAARPDVAPAEEWTPLPDGSWLSPGGKRYRAARIVAVIVSRRAALGLPTSFEAAAEHYRAVEVCAAQASEAERFWERVESVDPASRWHTSDKRNPAVEVAS